jgi:hypothetical protein
MESITTRPWYFESCTYWEIFIKGFKKGWPEATEAEVALYVAAEKFGQPNPEVVSRFQALPNLDRICERIAEASDWADMIKQLPSDLSSRNAN